MNKIDPKLSKYEKRYIFSVTVAAKKKEDIHGDTIRYKTVNVLARDAVTAGLAAQSRMVEEIGKDCTVGIVSHLDQFAIWTQQVKYLNIEVDIIV